MAHNKNKLPACSNCGYQFSGPNNFCPECGQENHDIRLPLKHHIHEVIEGLLHLDTKSFRTLNYLALKPGMLSREFNEGKRVRFVPAIRLYIFISFIFFLLLSTGSIIKKTETEKEKPKLLEFPINLGIDKVEPEEKEHLTKAGIDSLQRYRSFVNSDELKGLTESGLDTLLEKKRMPNVERVRDVFRKLAKFSNDHREARQYFSLMLKDFSYAMFLLMPLIGIVFYLFYRHQFRYYIEALVCSIHYHCFIFLLFSILFFIDKFINLNPFFYLGAWAVVAVYLYFTFKGYFNQRVLITILKTAVIFILQSAIVGVIYMLIGIVSFYFQA